MNRSTALALGIALALSVPAQTQSPAHRLLARVADPLLAGDGRRPLSEALAFVSGPTLRTFIDFGIEIDSGERDQPMIQLDATPGLTVGEVLDRAFAQIPGYGYAAKSPHFISVAPTWRRSDPNDILNLKVARFDVEGAQSGRILSWPELFIPELKRKLHPGEDQPIEIYMGAVGIGPLVTLHLRDVTVREILDAVGIATESSGPHALPLGWLFTTKHPTGSAPVPHWQLFASIPGNWRDLWSRDPRQLQ